MVVKYKHKVVFNCRNFLNIFGHGNLRKNEPNASWQKDKEALAAELGISQQAISKLEQSEEIEDSTLEKIASALGLPTDAIRNFNEEAVFNIIGNTFTDSSSNNNNYLCTINPLEKIIELYERLLASEKEKNELLKKK